MPVSRSTFLARAAAATALVLIAQWLFFGERIGATLGGFALAWCAAVAVAVPGMRRGMLAVAALLALVLIDDPSLLGWSLFWTAIASAALLQRRRFDDAIAWGLRLAALGASGVVSPILDLRNVLRRRRRARGGRSAILTLVALPAIGGAAFLTLFALANPVIGTALSGISLPSFWDAAFRTVFAVVVLVAVWPTFRPRAARIAGGIARESGSVIDLPVATLTLSLAVFNAVFALQNALDIAFLWSGAPLPDGVTLAD